MTTPCDHYLNLMKTNGSEILDGNGNWIVCDCGHENVNHYDDCSENGYVSGDGYAGVAVYVSEDVIGYNYYCCEYEA